MLDRYLDDGAVYVVTLSTGTRLVGTLHAHAQPTTWAELKSGRPRTSLVRLVPNDNPGWWHDFNPAHVVVLRPLIEKGSAR